MRNSDKKNKIKISSLMAKLAVFGLGVYLLVSLVITQVDIVARRHQLSDVEAELSVQLAQNDETKRILASGNEDDYVERIARDKLGYVRQDERIFQDTSGK